MRIVVYTAAFGNKFGFVPQKKQKGVDFVCFTDNLKKVPKPWKGILINNNNLKDNSLKNRHIKLLPHLYFKDYDYSIYIDSNYLVIGDLKKAVTEIGQHPMGIFDHNQASDKRDCVYDEYEAILALGTRKGKFKDVPTAMKKQIEFIKNEGYPKNNGLIFAGVLIRKHNEPKVIQVMEQWWSFVSTQSKRDQLSFDYVAWKNNFKPYVFKGDLRRNNEYFYNLGSNRKNYWKKLLQYKLKALFK